MGYSTGSHTIFHNRYHIVWAPKYRSKVLHGEVRTRVRDIIRQVCAEMGVTIVSGALSRDHVHMFVEIPPHIRVCDFVRMAKGRSSRKIQQEFEHTRRMRATLKSGSAVWISSTDSSQTTLAAATSSKRRPGSAVAIRALWHLDLGVNLEEANGAEPNSPWMYLALQSRSGNCPVIAGPVLSLKRRTIIYR